MICRMCLNESFNLIEIFGEEGHQMGISSVISDHFWFQPTIDDPVSTSICNDCWRNTESFHVFYLNVKTAQDLLAAAQPVAYIVKAEPEEPFEYPNTKSLVSGRQRSNCDNYQSTINVSGSDFTTDSNSGTSFAQKTQASYANQSALSREGLLKTEPDDYGEVSYTDSQLISPNIALLNEEGMDVGSTALLPSNETVILDIKNNLKKMEKRICQIWSADRIIKKVFSSVPTIRDVIEKAHTFGLIGNKLVLESDGAEICDDETFLFYAESRAVLMILNEDENWIANTSHLGSNLSTILTSSVPEASSQNQPPPDGSFSRANEKQFVIFDDECRPMASTSFDLLAEMDTEDISNYSLGPALSNTTEAFPSSSSCNKDKTILFSNFEIPWRKMPPDVMQLLEKKQFLNKRINALANIIVDELRSYSIHISMAVFRSAAQKVFEKYPDSIIEKDNNGKVISTNPIALITTMRNRNNTLNRAPKRKSDENEPKLGIKHRKTVAVLQQTCTNWQTPISEDSSVDFKIKYLLEQYPRKDQLNKEEESNVRNYMMNCFAKQREYLNNREEIPEITQIQKKWPFIFEKEHVYNHFEKLVNINPEILKTNYSIYKEKIIRELKFKENIEDVEIIRGLAKYFNEKSVLIFQNFKYDDTLEKIIDQIPTNSPWLAIIDSRQGSEDAIGYIFIDRIKVFTSDKFNLLDAVTLIVAYFYVFNIMYPKDICQTMEFLVRLLLKHYTPSIRGEKKSVNNINKINSLIKKLNR